MDQIRRKDIALRLDGAVMIEGAAGTAAANALVTNNAAAMKFLRQLAPDIKASDISVDSFGRVVIDNVDVSTSAQALATAQDISAFGSDISALGGTQPSVSTATGTPSPPDDITQDLNFFCKPDVPTPNDPILDLDIVCGPLGGCDDTNFICGWGSA